MILIDFTDLETKLEIEMLESKMIGTVVSKPFYDPNKIITTKLL